jgi:acetyl esterase
VVFFQGGVFVFCDVETHDGFCRQLARGTDALVLSVDYRLAPEHPAPAAADDAFAAVRWAVEHADELGGDPDRVVSAGDSAGGNLASVVTLMARDVGGPQLAGQVLIYPVVDRACAHDSYDRYAEGYFNTTAAMRWYWEQYAPAGHDPAPAHYVEPLRAEDLSGLPPALVVSAALDPLVDEARTLAARLRADGVPVCHREYGGLFHGFLTILPLQAAQSARDVLWQDLRDLLGVPGPAPGAESPDREGASA